MKILCAFSGIEFQCEHFPASLFSREAYHPIFNLPQKKLISYLGKWAAGELTETDNYLLYLAILKSTDLVEFRVPTIRTTNTPRIIAGNMENLVRIVTRMNVITNPGVHFPHCAITPETKDLTNSTHWIYNWQEAYQEFVDGKGKDYDDRKLVHREAALERLIRSPHRPISSYISQIAEWASVAGNFPTFPTIDRINQERVECAIYWKRIIIKCGTENGIFSINREDLEELIEHCESEIPIGSVFSNALYSVLRKAREKHKNFLGLGDLDLKGTVFNILQKDDTVEYANMTAMINSAPMEEPKRESYPSKFEYMKAKLRYDMSKKYPGPGGNTQ